MAFVIGGIYGVAGTIGQASLVLGLPLGLVIAIVGAAALVVGMRLLTADRWTGVAAGVGIMLTTLVFSGEGPGGSVVVPAPTDDGQLPTGVIWTIAVPVLVALIAGWPASHAETRTERTN